MNSTGSPTPDSRTRTLHGRRRDVDPTLLHVEPVRHRDALFDRPEPRLDPHRREPYAERGAVVLRRMSQDRGRSITDAMKERGLRSP